MWMSTSSKKSRAIPSDSALARMKLKAADADSFITSPNCPVRVSPFFPFMAVASINRRSPPVGVQASPMTTPGFEVRAVVSVVIRSGPR